MTRTRIAIMACLLLLVLAFGGCGDDAPSKAEFVEEGDKICMEFDEVEKKLEADAEAAGEDTDKLAKLFEEFADEGESTSDKLEELGAPEGQEEEVERYISETREQIDQLRKAAKALGDGDQEEFASIVEEGQAKGDELDKQAEELGFKVCGEESS